MAIESIEPVGQGIRSQEPSVADPAPSGGETEEFTSFLDAGAAAGQPSAAQPDGGVGLAEEAAPTIPAPSSVETTQPAAATAPAEALEANPVVGLLEQVGDSGARLDALLAEINSGRTFSLQELAAFQAEVYALTLRHHAATTVVTQGIQSVNTLFQQQV